MQMVQMAIHGGCCFVEDGKCQFQIFAHSCIQIYINIFFFSYIQIHTTIHWNTVLTGEANRQTPTTHWSAYNPRQLGECRSSRQMYIMVVSADKVWLELLCSLSLLCKIRNEQSTRRRVREREKEKKPANVNFACSSLCGVLTVVIWPRSFLVFLGWHSSSLLCSRFLPSLSLSLSLTLSLSLSLSLTLSLSLSISLSSIFWVSKE